MASMIWKISNENISNVFYGHFSIYWNWIYIFWSFPWCCILGMHWIKSFSQDTETFSYWPLLSTNLIPVFDQQAVPPHVWKREIILLCVRKHQVWLKYWFHHVVSQNVTNIYKHLVSVLLIKFQWLFFSYLVQKSSELPRNTILNLSLHQHSQGIYTTYTEINNTIEWERSALFSQFRPLLDQYKLQIGVPLFIHTNLWTNLWQSCTNAHIYRLIQIGPQYHITAKSTNPSCCSQSHGSNIFGNLHVRQ